MSPTGKAVCFGEALVDFFPADASAFGRPLREVDVFRRYSGGAPANTAVGLARLGVPTALITTFANDEMGEYLMATLRDEGVELLLSRTSVGPTSLAFIAWDRGGDRRFAFYRRSGADEQIEPAVVEAHRGDIGSAAVLCCCTNTLIRDPMAAAHRLALEIAAEGRVPVAVDLNLRVHLWPSPDEARDGAELLLGRARLLKADQEEASMLTDEADPEAAARALLSRAPDLELACVTLGERGAAWAHRAGGSGVVPAPAVQVQDTTGAGDAFTAALVAGWLAAGGPGGATQRGESAARLVRAAVQAGSRAVGSVGATTGMPTQAELAALVAAISHG